VFVHSTAPSSSRSTSLSGDRGSSDGNRSPSSSVRMPVRSRISHPERLVPSASRPLQRPVPRFHPSQLRPSGVTGGSRTSGGASGGAARIRGTSSDIDSGGRQTVHGTGLGPAARRLPNGPAASKLSLPSTSMDSNSQSFLALINSSKYTRCSAYYKSLTYLLTYLLTYCMSCRPHSSVSIFMDADGQ